MAAEVQSSTTESQSNQSSDSLIKMFEDLFRDRYTEKDEVYMQTVNRQDPPPPCVRNWYTKSRRNYNRSGYRGRGGGDRGRGYRGYRDYRQDDDRRGGYDNRDYRGHGDSGGGYHHSNRDNRGCDYERRDYRHSYH